MEKLENRQNTILRFIVEQYVEQAHPVSSGALQRDADLSWSSSTLRSEMKELERLGFVAHPHTSAGRIPTDKGYRYYVDQIMEPTPLGDEIAHLITQGYEGHFRSADEIFSRTLHILSSVSHLVGLVIVSSRDSFVVKHVSLTHVDGNFITVVCVSTSGLTRSFVVDMQEQLSTGELDKLSQVLNHELTGFSCAEIETHVIEKLKREKSSLKRLHRKLLHVTEELVRDEFGKKVYSRGSSALLREPEFHSSEAMQPILDVLDRDDVMHGILKERAGESGIQISIGADDGAECLRECALISMPYQLGDSQGGSIGLLGPKRMRYSQLTNLVSSVAENMNESFKRWT